MASSDEIVPPPETTTESTVVIDESYYDTLMQVSNEIFTNPINLVLLSISAFLLYKIVAGRQAPRPRPEPEVELPPMKKRDMTLEELKQYTGKNGDGRICIGVNGRIYDVTRGKTFYGPGGPYSIFAGRDASRAFALFTVKESAFKSGDDDLSDLTSTEMNRMREWQIQLEEKYVFVGRLLKPGQEPVDYTDSEEEEMNPNEDGDAEKEKETSEKIEEIKDEHDSKTSDIKDTTKEIVDDVDDVEDEEKELEVEEVGETQEVKEEVKEKVEEKEVSTEKTEL